jgi:hypothetical protein
MLPRKGNIYLRSEKCIGSMVNDSMVSQALAPPIRLLTSVASTGPIVRIGPDEVLHGHFAYIDELFMIDEGCNRCIF